MRKAITDELKRRGKEAVFKLIFGAVFGVISLLYITYHPKFSVADHIERLIQEAAGANVNITQFEMLPHAGGASIERLTVNNPQGFRIGSAVEFNGIGVKFDPASLRTGHLVIQELTIRKAIYRYETSNRNDNLRTLMRNAIAQVDRLYNAPPKLRDQVSMATDPAVGTAITINTLRILDGHIVFTNTAGSQPDIHFPIPPLELWNVTRNRHGLSQQEAVAELAMVLIRHGSRAVDAAFRQGLPRNARPAR